MVSPMDARHTYPDGDLPATTGRLVPIGEAARRIGFSIETIRRWANSGDIASTRTPGGQRRFTEAEIERFIAEMHAPKERAS